MANYFEELNKIDVNDKVKGKGNLSYLPWAYAWQELKKKHPDANYTIYENEQGWNYHTDGRYAWVKTGVTVGEVEHIEYLPVMDYKNNSITVDRVTSFDVNKTIQRSLTKAVARHGLGLYIYAGEDLPDESDGTAESRKSVKASDVQKNIKEEKAMESELQNQITKIEAQTLKGLINSYGAKEEDVLKAYKVASVDAMSKEEYAQCVKLLEQKYGK